jgi:hypothetical protein
MNRRRNANFDKPNKVAHHRWCYILPARLVCRASNCLYLHQYRTRHRPSQHVISHGSSLSDHRSFEQCLSRNLLSTSGLGSGNPWFQSRRQCYHSDSRSRCAWSSSIQCKLTLTKFSRYILTTASAPTSPLLNQQTVRQSIAPTASTHPWASTMVAQSA